MTLTEFRESFDILSYIGEYTELISVSGGLYYVGLCPLHPDTKRSLMVKGQSFRCFGCNTSGDAIDFYIAVNRMKPTKESFKKACEALGVELGEHKRGKEPRIKPMKLI